MIFETYLPVFNGFYETNYQFYYEDIEEYIKEERKEKGLYSDINFNDLKIDHSQYEKDIINLVCKEIKTELKQFIKKIELQKIISPREYNFSNDSANILIDVNVEEIQKFVYDHKQQFEEFLTKRYSSYDGFISHYEPDFLTWEVDTKKFTDFSINDHYLGSILDFIAHILKIDNFSIYSNICDDIIYLDYVENLEDIIHQQNGTLCEFLTSNGISKIFSAYIETSFNNNLINSLLLDEKTLFLIEEYKAKLVNV